MTALPTKASAANRQHSALRTVPSDPDFERGDHVELAGHLLRTLEPDGHPRVVYAEGALYRYDPTGVWLSVAESEQSVALQLLAGRTVRTAKGVAPLRLRSNDILGAMRLAQDQRAQPAFFDGAGSSIAFTNGVATVTADRVEICEPHADQRIRVRYPFAFNPTASAPRFEAFLVEIFQGDRDYSDKISVLQEFLGACIVGQAAKYGKAIVATGEGANGKSVFCAVAEAAMPAGTTSAIAPQLWSDQYRRARLVGKRLNVVSELPEADILDSEAFKAIVTGDRIDARPIREAPFEFRPIAGHLCAANRLPGTTDHTFGFWRRLTVVPFGRIFATTEQDASLAQTIIATEIPGVVRWALEGARRLLSTGRYTEPASSQEAVAAWRRGADPVALFVEESTTVLLPSEAFDVGTPAMRLYEGFKEWCLRNGHRPMASNKFGARMKLLGKEAKHTARGNFYPVKFETSLGAPGRWG